MDLEELLLASLTLNFLLESPLFLVLNLPIFFYLGLFIGPECFEVEQGSNLHDLLE